MKTRYAYTCLAALLLWGSSYAQVRTVKNDENVDSAQLDESKDLQAQLIPLDSIISIALKNSPAVKFQQDLIDAAKYQVHFIQEMWTNNFVPFFNYTASNQNLITADNQSPGGAASSSLTNGYRAGIQINFPLYEFVGRKARVNLYKAQLQSAIDKQDQTKQEFVQVLIEEYYSLIYYHNLIAIRSDAKQSTINQSMVAEQEFKDGIIQSTELSRLKSIEVNARADYEEAKREFAILYFQFQNMVRAPLPQLMRTK